MPPRVFSSLTRSFSSWRTSFFGSRSAVPSVPISESFCSRSRLFRIVLKLVSIPPSQRWLTYGVPARRASSSTASCACFFVPTKRTVFPSAAMLRTAS